MGEPSGIGPEVAIAALARRYLRDLKRDANIQVRDDSKPDALIR